MNAAGILIMITRQMAKLPHAVAPRAIVINSVEANHTVGKNRQIMRFPLSGHSIDHRSCGGDMVMGAPGFRVLHLPFAHKRDDIEIISKNWPRHLIQPEWLKPTPGRLDRLMSGMLPRDFLDCRLLEFVVYRGWRICLSIFTKQKPAEPVARANAHDCHASCGQEARQP